MLSYADVERAVRRWVNESPEDRAKALVETSTFAEFVRRLVDERYEQLQQEMREDNE